MKPVRLIGLAVAAAMIVVQAGTRVDAQDRTFHGDAHAVLVYASVTNKAGQFVPGLTRDDFDVRDNGKKQVLTAFSAERQPITAVLMLDRSGSGPRTLKLEHQAALEFLQGLTPEDRIRIGGFATTTKIEPAAFTSDHQELERVLNAQVVEAGPTPLWNAAAAAIAALSHEEGRRVLVLFTDGHDSPDPSPDNVSLSALSLAAENAGVMVYTVGLAFECEPDNPAASNGRSEQRGGGGQTGGGRGGAGGRGGRGERGGRGGERPCTPNGAIPDPGLKLLAEDGGGVYTELQGSGDLSVTFLKLAADLHRRYLLAFTPAVLDGKLHEIIVTIKSRSGLTVRARRNYFATADQ